MNDLKIGFNWYGLVIFILPMIINVIYVILPPNETGSTHKTCTIAEIIENATRILYLFAIFN